MRAITGKYKGRHFEVPRNFKARPTTDFAKENLFNVLKAYLDFEDCHALDLFSGTGNISLELLSRGCPRVVAVEKDFLHYKFIYEVMKSLKEERINVLKADVLKFIPKATEQFNFIFADPPYKLQELANIPEMIFNSNLLADDALFVLEHGKDYDFSSNPHFVEHREYGSVNFSFFK